MEDNVIIDPNVGNELQPDTLAQTDEIIPAVDTTCNDGGIPAIPAIPAVSEPETPNPEGEMTIGCFFGTLQECVTIVWRYHLKTRKYSTHKILKDFYDGALDIVDSLIEQWQGVHSVIEQPFINCITGDDKDSETYLYSLKGFIESNSHIIGDDSEIKSTLDNFMSLIDSTIYQLTTFTEHNVKSYDEFCYENLNESCSCEHCDEDDEENEEEEE